MWTLTPTESANVDASVGVTAGRTGYVVAGGGGGGARGARRGGRAAGASAVVVVVVVGAVVVVGVVAVYVVLRSLESTARRLARMLRWAAAQVTTGRCLALTRPSRRRSVMLAPRRPVTRMTFWPATRQAAQWRRPRGTSVMATRST